MADTPRQTSQLTTFADNQPLLFGSSFSISTDGTNLEILPVINDEGAVHIGNGTTDCDFKWFAGSTANYIEFNAGDGLVNVVGIGYQLDDGSSLNVGDGADIVLSSDGTNGIIDGGAILLIGATDATAIQLSRAAGAIGLYGATPVAQHTATGDTTGFVAGSVGAAFSDSVYAGASGSAAYTVGDIVTALKAIGIMDT